MFEYGGKGLPHALVHAPELVQTGGHHGAFCSAVVESGHKHKIKKAAKFSRTHSSQNDTQDEMLMWVLRDSLWTEVIQLNKNIQARARAPHSPVPELTPSPIPNPVTHTRLNQALPYCSTWSTLDCTVETPRVWGATFISKKVLVTRDELVTLLRSKLGMDQTLQNVARLATRLQWRSFGAISLRKDNVNYHFVGISSLSPRRRDFVRTHGTLNDTALGVQVCMCPCT